MTKYKKMILRKLPSEADIFKVGNKVTNFTKEWVDNTFFADPIIVPHEQTK